MMITPHTNLLRSLRGERIKYWLVIGEGVDNALDAGAKSVVVDINDQVIRFTDDGSGITPDRVSALVSLGEHGSMTSTALGRFGVGIKSQAINAGDQFSVDSISSQGRLTLRVNWREILQSQSWMIDDPTWRSSGGLPTGTTIEISALRQIGRFGPEQVALEIAERFYPALADGKKIVLNGEELRPLPEPKMTHLVEGDLALSGGRSARVRAGMLVGSSSLNRVHVSYRHRVIMPKSPLGCGGYGGINRLFARVQIFGPWHLAKFKDDLPDDSERDELEDAVEDLLRPILEECNRATLSANTLELSRLINERIPDELAPARPKKGAKKPETEVKKKGTQNNPIDRDRSDVGGPARSPRSPRDKLKITFDGSEDECGVGMFKAGRPHRVELSADHSYVQKLMTYRDHSLAAEALYALAIAIYEEGRASGQGDLFKPFGRRVSDLLAIQDINEASA